MCNGDEGRVGRRRDGYLGLYSAAMILEHSLGKGLVLEIALDC